MEKQILIQRFFNLVHLTEDYLSTGFRSGHPELTESRDEQQTASGGAGISPGERLESLKQRILTCKKCHLHYSRMHAVPGEGSPDADVFIIGNGPDEEEDSAGRPFAGKTGDYLHKWLAAIELNTTEHCFTCNIVRCRPPQNRDPGMEETRTCFPYIDEQIALIKPGVILCLGRIPGQVVTGKLITSVAKLRGEPLSYKGIPLIVTYHPAFVLQNQNLRKPVWEDLKRLKLFIEKRTR